MLRLHHAPHSCSLATLVVLEELHLDFELRRVDTAAGQQRGAAFLAINPKGRVPVLETAAGVLTETPAILAYLASTAASPRLLPSRPFDLARLHAFNAYLCSTVHVAHAHRMRGYRWADDEAAFRAMQAKVPSAVTEAFAVVEDHLLVGPWVMGEAYSIADPYLFTLAQWLEADGADLGRLPRILDHRARMLQRPAVQRALAQETPFAPAPQA